MFYQGELQSGIALAMQTQKHVICLVCDDGDTSKSWEEALAGEKIAGPLSRKAVTLRIVQGSVEAGYLTAFVPIQDAPAIVCIGDRNSGGQFGLYSNALNSSNPDEMSTWLLNVLGEGDQNTRQPADSAESSVHSRAHVGGIDTENVSDSIKATSSSADNEALTTSNSTEQPNTSASESTQSSLPQSEAPIPIQSSRPVTRSEPEPASTSKKGKQRATNTTPPPTPTPTPTPANNSQPSSNQTEAQSWAAKQRQRNIDARKDRDRVLAQIEADKQARRDREAALKADAAAAAAPIASSLPRKPKAQSSSSSSKTARIQVRLANGSSIRKSFTPTSTPATALRPWIDAALRDEGHSSVPAYRLKHVPGPPEPARPIDVVDEQRSLQELDLLPSATLVLVPVQGSVDAYGNEASWGLLDLPVAAVGVVAGAVTGALGWVTGRGNGQSQETQNVEQQGDASNDSAKKSKAQTAGPGTGRIRTMAEMRAEGDGGSTQLYNGNQLNFQPSEDDDN